MHKINRMWRLISSRTRCYLLLCFIAMIIMMMLRIYSNYKRDKPKMIYWPPIENNIICRYRRAGDVLPSAEDSNFSPGEKAIFFHETSCRGGINSRQACAVESAARMNPGWQINLLFTSPIEEFVIKESILAILLEFKNIKAFRIHIEEYSNGTIVEDILMKSIKNSIFPVEHLADILKILTLHKFGGVTLDTDIVVTKSFDPLPPNWIAKESDLQIATGAIALAKDGVGANLTTTILTEIRDTYSPMRGAYNGPQAIQRVLNRTCPDVIRTDGDCKGLRIYPAEYFYSVNSSMNRLYFNSEPILIKLKPFMHHMWNHLSKNLTIELDSVYGKLARQYCPSIFHINDDFGA